MFFFLPTLERLTTFRFLSIPSQTPCERCVRLKKTCIPHASRQGKGKKRRRSGGGKETATEKSGVSNRGKNHAPSKRPKGEGQPTEDVLVKSISTGFGANHFGVRFLIRSWVSFAVRRRSFALLTRAGMLATRIGISMDEIFCGEDGDISYGPASFLCPALIMPSARQSLRRDRLKWSDIPSDLLASVRCSVEVCSVNAGNCCDDDASHREAEEDVKSCQNAAELAVVVADRTEEEILLPILGDRWIFVREMKEGQSRYFCSPAFERDICEWSVIRDTWVANKKEVASLFSTDEYRAPYVKSLIHQMKLNDKPGMRPKASRYRSKIIVRTGAGGQETTMNVNTVACLKIVDVDTAYFYLEFTKVLDKFEAAAALASVSVAIPCRTPSFVDRRGSNLSVSGRADSEPPNIENIEWLNLDELEEMSNLDEFLGLFGD